MLLPSLDKDITYLHPDQTAPLGAVWLEKQSDLGLHCLPRPISQKT